MLEFMYMTLRKPLGFFCIIVNYVEYSLNVNYPGGGWKDYIMLFYNMPLYATDVAMEDILTSRKCDKILQRLQGISFVSET